jgi:hypothetical protein
LAVANFVGEERVEQSTSKAYSTPAMAQATTPVITASGTGSALFVINLCASMAPIATAGKTLPGFENYRLYQVARAEDGRTRHRLRLGFFTSEAETEKALAIVRAEYPTAFTACLADEDKKFTRGFISEAAPAPKPQMAVVVDNDSTRPQMKALQIATPPVVEKAAAAAPPPVRTQAPAPAQPASAQQAPAPQAPIKPVAAAPVAPAVKAPAAASTAKPPVAPVSAKQPEAVEIEITFEQPALKVPATPPKAVAPAAPAPVAKAPAAEAPAKSASLELAAPGARLPTAATGQHRGIVATKAPALESIDLSLANDTVAGRVASKAATATPTQPNQPFHVGKGVDLPATNLTLDSAIERGQQKPSTPAAAAPAQRPSQPAQATPAAAVAKSAAPTTTAPVTAKSPATAPAAPAKVAATTAPFTQGDLDSTQTIRALTDAELNDETQDKWFAIQLAVSDQPMNLDAMPHLDIFEAYRPYSVAAAGSGKITHSLRIGFFREHVSAEAVAGYLKTFFSAPSVVRISVAEHARFKEPAEKPAPTSESSEGKVVAISDARARKPVIPTVTMEVETPDGNATGSFKPNATGSFKPNATGSFKPNATGSFKPNATGSFKPNATGSFKPGATGAHRALKTAAKGTGTAIKRSPAAAMNKKSATGKHPALPKKRLSEELNDVARDVDLEESGVRQLTKSGSLLSRLVGKLTN